MSDYVEGRAMKRHTVNRKMPRSAFSSVEDHAKFLLSDAENEAWVRLAQGKYGQFGYWAAKVVQFRELLGLTHTPTPFKELVLLARSKHQVGSMPAFSVKPASEAER